MMGPMHFRCRYRSRARAFVLGWLVAGLPAWAAESRPPNFVLLLADDLGYGDLSCYGHPTIRTPQLDRIATEGIRLTSFYAQPSCTPSRVALMTGRYPLRAGLARVLMPADTMGLPASEVTLAEVLKGRGYRTAAFGKWHLGHHDKQFFPTNRGFDEYYGLIYSNDMMPPWVQTDRPLELYRGTEAIEHPVEQSTLTERYCEEAIRFIRQSKGSPFFVYLAYAMPHVPLHASEKFAGRSRRGLYGDVVETIDFSVGRILEALRAEGLDDNTLVIFASDNGPWMEMGQRMLQGGYIKPWDAGSAGLLRGSKGSAYEGGIRVPCVARWPGRIPAGQVSAEMASTMDLYTTLVNLAGGTVPADRVVDGLDIFPLLAGMGKSPRQRFYYFAGHGLEAVRENQWKLRLCDNPLASSPAGQPPTPELYNLDLDPAERFNVAQDHPEIVLRLAKEIRSFAQEIGATAVPWAPGQTQGSAGERAGVQR